jgi:hypothetical protein
MTTSVPVSHLTGAGAGAMLVGAGACQLGR